MLNVIKRIMGFDQFDFSLGGIFRMVLTLIDALVVLLTVYASTENFKDYAFYLRLPLVGFAVAFRYVYIAFTLFFG